MEEMVEETSESSELLGRDIGVLMSELLFFDKRSLIISVIALLVKKRFPVLVFMPLRIQGMHHEVDSNHQAQKDERKANEAVDYDIIVEHISMT